MFNHDYRFCKFRFIRRSRREETNLFPLFDLLAIYPSFPLSDF